MYLLLKHPEYMQRLQTEVRALKKDELTLEVLSHLPFMTACITEGLRVYSPAPIPFFRAVPKGGNVICGELIPESVCTSQTPGPKIDYNLNEYTDPRCSPPLRSVPQPSQLQES
jgi:hypothetical protein